MIVIDDLMIVSGNIFLRHKVLALKDPGVSNVYVLSSRSETLVIIIRIHLDFVVICYIGFSN